MLISFSLLQQKIYFCTVESPKRFLPRPTLTIFYANLDELGDPSYFQKIGEVPADPPVSPRVLTASY